MSFLPEVGLSEIFGPFAFFRENFGFIPNIFRAQTLRPDVLEAEPYMVDTVLLSDDILTRVQKEYILLVISAANLNTYCVAVHCEMLPALEVHEHTSDQIAVDHHHGRIYHTLIGITEDHDDAEDGTQNVFLKAFSRIDQFQGASKFSTWLMRIAINEALERLRARKKRQSLFEDGPEELDEVRPRQVEAWHDNPERLYAQKQLRELVEKELMKLPASYRVVVLLWDIEQLSTEEAAAALGLGIAALKTRLLRGRLMLREALAPHFLDRGERSACV
jgi:RNA polymerase sigma-70 factor (ECF subfamily)